MSSAIGGIGGSSSMMMQGMGRMQRPDASKMAEALFSKLDTGGKGYIEQADLQAAFQQVPTANSGSAEEVFATLDGDSDGKVTRQEMSDSLRKLSEALDDQFNSMRMRGGGAGLTAADLNGELAAIGNSDSQRADTLTRLLENFDQTDADSKVNREETQADRQSSQNTAEVMKQIMNLAQAYGLDGGQAGSIGLSVSA
ncbi:MAG: EF-hand domain-containing protein [Thiobacillus sp.]|nr:EF-hand domain-containing protein [Thiobacillus sp.]